MNLKHVLRIATPMLLAGFVGLSLSLSAGAASVSASSGRNGQLHLAKECSQYTGQPGDFCTFTYSNLAQIDIGSKVFYDQAAGVPPDLVDSNVVLDAGNGDRAVGRCTLDIGTGRGLCTFSDGTGELSGFEARVDVVCTNGGLNCTWDGPYKFNPQHRK